MIYINVCLYSWFVCVCKCTFFFSNIKKSLNRSAGKQTWYKGRKTFITWIILFTWPKRASLRTKESLFDKKEEIVIFFCKKSLLCRYSALSLHSETDESRPLSDSFSRSAFALPSLWLRSGFISRDEERRDTGWKEFTTEPHQLRWRLLGSA